MTWTRSLEVRDSSRPITARGQNCHNLTTWFGAGSKLDLAEIWPII